MSILTLNTSDTAVFDDVSGVYVRLQDYNTAYTNYLTCLESRPKYTMGSGGVQFTKDPSANYTYDAEGCRPPNMVLLNQQIEQLQRDISSNISDTMTYQDISQKYNALLVLRKELDRKVADLYEMNTNIPVAAYQDADTAVYAVMLWATLASCLIYYVTML